MNVVRTANWTLELPDDWEVQPNPECITMVRPEGVGALQISTALKKNGDVTVVELRDIAEDHIGPGMERTGTKSKGVKLGDFSGVELRYGHENHAWRIWFLGSGAILLFVTYNCDAGDSGTEDDDIDAILVTLKRI